MPAIIGKISHSASAPKELWDVCVRLGPALLQPIIILGSLWTVSASDPGLCFPTERVNECPIIPASYSVSWWVEF